MTKKDLQKRLKVFAISIIRLAEGLPESLGFRTVRNEIKSFGVAPQVRLNIGLPAGEINSRF